MEQPGGVAFSSIDFGLAEAEQEAADFPGLLMEGFFDLHRSDRLLEDRHFLLLGRKGSGKSAVFQHLRLAAADTDDFVTVRRMGSFPFNDFAAIESGGATDYSRLPSTWRLILLLNLVHSLSNDRKTASFGSGEFQSALRRLKDSGLLPTNDLRSLVLSVAKTSGGFSLGGLSANREITRNPSRGDLGALTAGLQEIVMNFLTTRRHVICLDGLDDLIFRAETRLHVLSALIEAVASLNTELREEQQPFKFLIACRTDMFSRLPGDNTNKLAQDRAVRLNWYEDKHRPETSKLTQLVNRKAAVTLPPGTRVLPDLLPATMPIEPKRADTLRYLLTYTRHTPRDMLRLLRYIQDLTQGSIPTEMDIKAGISNYSREYFLDEVMNELDNHRHQTANKIFEYLRELGRHTFTSNDLFSMAAREDEVPLPAIRETLKALYDASAIGNFSKGSTAYYTFKYRNERSSLAMNGTMMTHNALSRALNLRMYSSNVEAATLAPRQRRSDPEDRRRRISRASREGSS